MLKVRILIVDDKDANGTLLEQRLRGTGYMKTFKLSVTTLPVLAAKSHF